MDFEDKVRRLSMPRIDKITMINGDHYSHLIINTDVPRVRGILAVSDCIGLTRYINKAQIEEILLNDEQTVIASNFITER